MCPVDYTAFVVNRNVRLHHTRLVTFVIPTVRPKSVRNRCIIDHLSGVLVSFWRFGVLVVLFDIHVC